MLPACRFGIGMPLLLLVVLPGLGQATEPADRNHRAVAGHQRAFTLVRKLGHPSFDVREQSAQGLKSLGVQARPALQQACDDPDLEIRYRSRRLLEIVEQLDHERRIAEFQKDTETAPDDILPGWQRYRQLAGRDPAACELFAAMQRAESKLFRLAEKDKSTFETTYSQRARNVLYGRQTARERENKLQTMAALLFFSSDQRFQFSHKAANSIYSFVYRSEFRSALRTGPYADCLRKLLVAWIARPDAELAYRKVTVAMQYDIPEGLHPALELIRSPAPASQLKYAMRAIGRFGGPEHIGELERLLHDETVLSVRKVEDKELYSSQVRDVALAVVLHLSDQEPKEYGFKRLRKSSRYLFSINSVGFHSPDERAAAFEKWRDWKSTHPDEKSS